MLWCEHVVVELGIQGSTNCWSAEAHNATRVAFVLFQCISVVRGP
jgi:hypothetical protein